MEAHGCYRDEKIVEACAWAAHDVGCVYAATVRRVKTKPWQELRRGKGNLRLAVQMQLARYPAVEDCAWPWRRLFQRTVNTLAESLGWDRGRAKIMRAKIMSLVLEEERAAKAAREKRHA